MGSYSAKVSGETPFVRVCFEEISRINSKIPSSEMVALALDRYNVASFGSIIRKYYSIFDDS